MDNSQKIKRNKRTHRKLITRFTTQIFVSQKIVKVCENTVKMVSRDVALSLLCVQVNSPSSD